MRRIIGLLAVFVIAVTGCTMRHIPDCADETGCIAFTSNRYQGISHIFIMRPDGTQVTRVAQGAQPAWSPDGKQIAFSSYLMNADGSDLVRLTESVKGWHPSWSPDGRYIAFLSAGSQLCVVALADRTRVQCFGLAGLKFPAYTAWSPDGGRIAISAMADGEEDGEIFVVGTECIGIVDECEPSITRLTDNGVRDNRPAWSPDGKHIAFARWSGPGEIAWADIWVMDADGTNAVRLTSGDVNYTDPDWSPDGKKIVFVESAIYLVVMNRDGSDATRVTESGRVKVKGEDFTPPIGSWDPDWWGVSVSEDQGSQ
jgi:Tol biopolymer transport system component